MLWNNGFCYVVLNDLYEKGSQSKKWLFSAPNSWDMGYKIQITNFKLGYAVSSAPS